MYFYLLDTFLQNKKYEKEIARIETRITDLGIGGQVARLNILKDINELVHDAVKRGITTVVAIGDDYTIGKVVDVVARYDVVLGIIPLGEQLAIAKILGIPQGEAA
ncbi:MAG TPA: diacylglycerol kinase family protein, partial [Patescibacteria group bacterium]|nr:diacylglycerol kinase family protein [Patescibacteria group bacterium]